MGGWESEGGGGGLGPIVWVRRRNGSWWPGKIMGPGELSECSLSSPRTGTPVKLLGREDASVDWYNLEKSKRVKAFRCGEFDDCIEKAESTHGMPVKKREKYARREDAILHALELEKQLLADQVKVPVASDSLATKLPESGKKKLPSIPEALGNSHGHIGNTRLPQASRVEVDVLDVTDGSSVHSPGTRFSYKRTWEDEHAEATPRMRGLQDLGLRTASLKRKYYPFESDNSRRDNHLRVPFSSAPTVGRMSYTNGGEQMGAFVRAKRSRCVYFPNGADNSFDDKENSSDQIRMSPQFEGSDFDGRRGLLKEDYSSSGVMEDEESNFSQSDSLGSESDSSETEQDTDDDTTASSESEPDALGHHEAPGDQESTSSEEPDDLPFSGDIAQHYPDDPYLSNEAVSKWPLKGKRNIRYVARDMPGNNGEYGRPSLGMYSTARTTGQRAYSGQGAHLDGKYTGTQVAGSDNGFPHPFRFPRKDRNLIDWDDVTWEDGRQFFNPMFYGSHNFGGRPRSMLVDVDLKVRSSYPRERVPIISLLSKLNGRAIVGHPIQIEALEDGSSESLIIPKNEYCIGETALLDGSPKLTSSWKTARRSNYRVPRPHVSSVLGGDDSGDFPLLAEQERRLSFKKSFVSSLGLNSSLPSKVPSHSPRPLLDRKFSRKSPMKVSLSSNQKTRTLSSIGSQHGFGTKTVHDTRGCQMDGLIKAETSGPTTVACIPVKLVFSRLLEKINRPPSKAVS